MEKATTHLDDSDRQWLGDLATLCRSHCEFILAEIKDSPLLAHYAARVLTWRDARFLTTSELVDLCEAHNWNTTIYEAWVWETEKRLYDMKDTLGQTASRAFDLVTGQLGYGVPNARAKDLALDYARACLEGTLTQNLKGNSSRSSSTWGSMLIDLYLPSRARLRALTPFLPLAIPGLQELPLSR